jgi:leucyl aminopeptidase
VAVDDRPEVELAPRPTAGSPRALLLDGGAWKETLERGHPALDADEHAALRRLASLTRFEAKAGQSLAWSLGDGREGIVVGRAASGRSTASLRTAAAHAAQLFAPARAWSLCWTTPAAADPASAEERATAVAEGVLLSTYRSKRSGRNAPPAAAGGCTLVADLGEAVAAKALERARALAAGVTLTRDLVNAPAAELGPDELADAALALARRHGLESEVVRGAEVAARGFRMVAAVGRGSVRPPTVTVLRRGGDSAAPLALIGKGVVFDSGGLDLKPSDAMLLMRKDMAGAATILGALEAAGRLGAGGPLLVVIPSAENMVGPDSYRPGDVLTAYDGTTVEIGNTDAEGRLLLADAMGYARERKAARLVDVATLTGAARVALGVELPALFGTDDELVELVERAAAASDERMWRMPLVDEYDRQLDTPFADVNHVSHDKRAGAITAALFLRRFAGSTPWAHVDLYAWEESGRPDTPKGANGMGVRTLVRVLEHFAATR